MLGEDFKHEPGQVGVGERSRLQRIECVERHALGAGSVPHESFNDAQREARISRIHPQMVARPERSSLPGGGPCREEEVPQEAVLARPLPAHPSVAR